MSRNIVVHSIDGKDHDFDRKYRDNGFAMGVKKNGEIVSESRLKEQDVEIGE